MLSTLKQVKRLITIQWIIWRYGLDDVLYTTPLFASLKVLRFANPFYWHIRHTPRAERIREALQALGPIFVKFGQAMSTRRDLLPEDIADELAKLQDAVPPFCIDLAQKMVEQALVQSVSTAFQSFTSEPLAAASIAQVHTAVLPNGKAVVVKILRPDIHQKIAADIALLTFLARLAERYWQESKRLKPIEVVAEFAQTLTDELDLSREAANASQLRRNFSDSDLLYVPEVYWPYVRPSLLVIERIDGIPVADISQLKAHGINMKALAERGVEIFFTQVFRDCFFHADMHPGNIFVARINPDTPLYLGVDFGIMGSLSPKDQRYLADNLLAFFHRDYRRVAQLHVESGWVPKDTRVDLFEADIRTVCEPIFERPLSEISFGQMLLKLFQTARRFNMEIQPQLVLLQKTLFNVEGLGRQLYPDLDLWNTAKPFLEQWLKDQMGPKAFFKKVKQNIPYWLEKMPELPDLIYQRLQASTEPLLAQKIIALEQELKQVKAKTRFWWGLWLGVITIGLLMVFTHQGYQPTW